MIINIINYLLLKILLPLRGKGKALPGLRNMILVDVGPRVCYYKVYIYKPFKFQNFTAITSLNVIYFLAPTQ